MRASVSHREDARNARCCPAEATISSRDRHTNTLLVQEAGLATGTAISDRSALVGLLPGADLPERLAVPSSTAGHAALEEPARQRQREEISQQGAETATGRPEPPGIASCEDAHAGCRRCQLRSLHSCLLHRKFSVIRRTDCFDSIAEFYFS